MAKVFRINRNFWEENQDSIITNAVFAFVDSFNDEADILYCIGAKSKDDILNMVVHNGQDWIKQHFNISSVIDIFSTNEFSVILTVGLKAKL